MSYLQKYFGGNIQTITAKLENNGEVREATLGTLGGIIVGAPPCHVASAYRAPDGTPRREVKFFRGCVGEAINAAEEACRGYVVFPYDNESLEQLSGLTEGRSGWERVKINLPEGTIIGFKFDPLKKREGPAELAFALSAMMQNYSENVEREE
jgi:hypothetical protein